jgi:PAS domain S-box-containing protein
MQDAPIPPDDKARVAALRSLDLLDSPPEQRFNRITRTAARLFGVPIATVTLVDENRQWFKSRYGLFVAETPRNVSFCGHAILNDEVFVIEDARADPRFADNPLVTGEPFIRFYAGRPIRTPGGVKLGTLCVMGREPRAFSDADLLTLEDLAGWAEREINLSMEFSRMHSRLVSVLENVAEGAILFGPDGNIEWANERLAELVGQPAASLHGKDIDAVVMRESLSAVRKVIEALEPNTERSTGKIDAQLRQQGGKAATVKMAFVVSVVDDERFVTAVINRL